MNHPFSQFLYFIIIYNSFPKNKMSKHRHTKDKMHMTYTEVREGMASKNKKKIPFEQLPFYCCSLSLAPF